jgi:stage III sporulation protein AB
MKQIAIAAIFTGCAVLGCRYSNSLGARLAWLEHFSQFFRRLEIEMGYAGYQLAPAIRKASESMECTLSSLFAGVAEDIERFEGSHPGEILQNRLNHSLNETGADALHERDKRMIIEFMNNLGCSDWESQKNNFEYIHRAVDQQVDQARQENAKKSKVYRTLGVLSGLLFAVLLV